MTEVRTGVKLVLLVTAAGWCAAILLWPRSHWFLCFDDAFYYFEIARNFAHGRGSTFDRLYPTNGYHPLWMLLCAPVFAGSAAGVGVVRAILVAQTLAWCAILGLSAKLLADAADPDGELAGVSRSARVGIAIMVAGSFGAVIAGPFLFKSLVNGMESTLYALCYTPLLALSYAGEGRLLELPLRQRLLFAVLASLAFLSRTDAILLFAAAGVWTLPAIVRGGRAGIARALSLFALPAATLALYLASNQLWFGSPLQVTASLKRTSLDAGRVGLIAIACAVPFVVAWLLGRPAFGPRYPRLTRFFRRTGWFGGFVCLLFAYYYGMQTFARPWYFGPAVLYAALAVPLALVDIALRRGALRSSALIGALLLGLSIGVQVYGVRRLSLMTMRARVADAAAWIDSQLPPDTRVGSWDAGLLGYLSEARIVNLDGVANSFEYLAAIDRGAQGAWVSRERIHWFANHATERGGQCAELSDWLKRHLPRTRSTMVKSWFVPAGGDGVAERVCIYRIEERPM